MSEIMWVTKDGLTKLKEELYHLKKVERPKISNAIAEAREKGDLRENAEYHAAKEAQGHLETKIARLETTIANARIIDESQMDTSKVYILSTVRVKNIKLKKEFKYTLVSEKEQNLRENRISVASPVGKGFLGKVVGDIVDIKVPAGVMQFEILEITRE